MEIYGSVIFVNALIEVAWRELKKKRTMESRSSYRFDSVCFSVSEVYCSFSLCSDGRSFSYFFAQRNYRTPSHGMLDINMQWMINGICTTSLFTCFHTAKCSWSGLDPLVFYNALHCSLTVSNWNILISICLGFVGWNFYCYNFELAFYFYCRHRLMLN